MTVIVGLVDNGTIYMGGDSAGIAGLSKTIRADEKVFRNGKMLFGFTTSFRMGQLLRYKFSPPEQTIIGQDDMSYMCCSFIDAVRQCFSGNGFGDKEATNGGTFLVGFNGVLYRIDSDHQVGISTAGYEAVGCGADLALGALHATVGFPPEIRVKRALEAAAAFSAGVSAPFTILKLEGAKKVPGKKRAKVK